MKKLYFIAILALMITESRAQQNPHYTQYMYNMSVINPAYAGSKENLTGGLLYRNQWVGLDGAPTTGTFFLHSPVGKNVGLGISAITDKIGPVEENNVYADFSYTVHLGGEHRLAFGLKGGATFHKVGLYSDINNGSLPNPDDDAFSKDSNSTIFNLGTGVFYYTNKYYVAFSIPNMMKGYYLNVNGTKYGSQELHYFLTGGYVFDINPNLKFKPFTMLKMASGSPVSFDINTNFLLYDKLELGASYRYQDSFGGMVNFAVTPNLKIGYAYDHITSDLKVATTSSHEVILLFDLNFPKKVSQSPRYF